MVRLKRVLSRAQEAVSRALVQQGLSTGWPIFVAVGWRLAMRPAFRVKAQKVGRNKLLVLSKSAGVEDVKEAYADNAANYAVLFLPREIVKLSGRFFLNERVSGSNYHLPHITPEAAKRQYRLHLGEVLDRFQRLFGLAAVVQFNLAYWAEREMAAACVVQGIRFVTVHKESNWTPGEIDNRIEFFSEAISHFEGTAVAVYNNATREILISAGVVEPERVYALGCARLDESHKIRYHSNQPRTKTVLFYLIENKAGTGQFRDDKTGMWLRGIPMSNGSVGNWSEMISKVNEAVMGLASEHNELGFICKGKTGFGDEQVQALLEASPGRILPTNVNIIKDSVGHRLLSGATVVIGFNTTAVLEAMAAGVPVIVPNIFSEQEKEMVGYTHDVNEGALVPTSPAELQTMILEVIKNADRYTELTQGQKNALNRMMGNSDGKAGQRLRVFLDKAVRGEL